MWWNLPWSSDPQAVLGVCVCAYNHSFPPLWCRGSSFSSRLLGCVKVTSGVNGLHREYNRDQAKWRSHVRCFKKRLKET